MPRLIGLVPTGGKTRIPVWSSGLPMVKGSSSFSGGDGTCRAARGRGRAADGCGPPDAGVSVAPAEAVCPGAGMITGRRAPGAVAAPSSSAGAGRSSRSTAVARSATSAPITVRTTAPMASIVTRFTLAAAGVSVARTPSASVRTGSRGWLAMRFAGYIRAAFSRPQAGYRAPSRRCRHPAGASPFPHLPPDHRRAGRGESGLSPAHGARGNADRRRRLHAARARAHPPLARGAARRRLAHRARRASVRAGRRPTPRAPSQGPPARGAARVDRRRDTVVASASRARGDVHPPIPRSAHRRSGDPRSSRVERGLGGTPARTHPVAVWAQARAALPPWRWYHVVWKFVVFALAPTAVLFNAHQHIAYGGSLGQYYLEGPGAYVRTFALYWLSVSLDLVLWAAVWRALAEGVALVMALVAPSHAARVRRAIEFACRLLYYAGAPALVAARFLA